MGQKGLITLSAIISKYPQMINTVICAKDKSVANDYYNEIHNICAEHNIQFLDRTELFNDNSPYSIAISWRWLIKKVEGKLITLHDSLLPKYRGFNPLVSCLINKEEEIGVTAIFSSHNYDEGDIIAQSKTRVTYPLKISEAIHKISENYVELGLEIFSSIHSEQPLKAYKQNNEVATYSLWRDAHDYKIDWSKSADHIQRFVDATGFPYKGASTQLDGKVIRIYSVQVCDDVHIENRSPGKVIFLQNGIPTIVCGQGLIKITEAYDENSNESILPLTSFRICFGR